MDRSPAAVLAANQPGVNKRASKACRRCRRLRTKCINQGGIPPCEPCRQARLDSQCSFPARGEPIADRAFRQSRSRGQGSRSDSVCCSSHSTATPPQPPPHVSPGRNDGQFDILDNPAVESLDSSLAGHSLPYPAPPLMVGWQSLPPYDEVVEGVQCLATSFFQLGFLPKSLFFERLRKDRDSVSQFLLCSILSVSARFTPCLVKRYRGGGNATRVFLEKASCFVQGQMFDSTLESIQSFFLISIAEWGNGDKNRSLVYMGIAIRLAGILRMHREETYRLPETATNEEIVYSEVARRTFWMLETFENLHSGSDSPIAFSYDDITVLLPCDEREFTFGIRPTHRAALAGTPPAIENPALARLPSRSLFATLLQTHNLWGQVARLVSTETMQLGEGFQSHISVENYGSLSQALIDFERDLPRQHTWSVWNLRGFKVEGVDLAYLSVVMVLRLSNIMLRRSYLHDILHSRRGTDPVSEGQPARRTEAWSAVADQLFDNMLTLHEQVAAFFEYRLDEQGYPALIVFCVYVCGSLANHLHRQPQLCPRVAAQAIDILRSSIAGLVNLQAAWPFARRWYLALSRASENVPLGDDVRAAYHDHANIQSSADAVQEEGDGAEEDMHTLEVQFNVPLPTDSMFEAFDMYAWDAVSPGDALWQLS